MPSRSSSPAAYLSQPAGDVSGSSSPARPLRRFASLTRPFSRFFASSVGLFVGMYLLVAVPMVAAGAVAFAVTDPPVDLGRATAFTSTVNGATMVEFPDGAVAPASLENVTAGDSVTVFLNGSSVTNDPSWPSQVALLWSLLAGVIGALYAFAFMLWHDLVPRVRRLAG